MLTEVLVASEFVSTALGLLLVYFFVRAYRFMRISYLLGLPVGFLFLAFSYVFLGFFLIFQDDVTVSNLFLWLRLVSQTYGFAFIAFSYYFSSNAERATKYFMGIISLASVFSVLLIFGLLIASPPFLGLPSAQVVDEYFRVANLVFLGYTMYSVVKPPGSPYKSASALLWAPFAFSILWVGQYSLLLWGLDGGQTAFIGAHIARLASLVMFIYVYHSAGKA